MKHRVFGKRLGRNTKSRKALLKSLVVSLVKNERIVTTTARAKVLKPIIDKLITKAKKQTLAARREMIGAVGSVEITSKIYDDLAFRFTDRTSGFTRLTKLGPRTTDKAKVSVIEFVTGQKKSTKKDDKTVEQKLEVDAKKVKKSTKKPKTTATGPKTVKAKK